MEIRTDITFERILAVVAAQAGVTVESIKARAEAPASHSNWPRQRAVLLARRIRPDLSLAWLAQRLDRRDYSTIHSAYVAGDRRHDDSLSERAAVKACLNELGLEELPPYRPEYRVEFYIDRDIRAAERRLEQLRQRKARVEAVR